jgi:succinylarginine dihydrolase
MKHKLSASNPRRAALEGLEKMKFVASLGVKQAVLPPHERPHLPTLRRLGFAGSDADVLAAARQSDPTLLAMVSSASAMWTANAATVCPSADSDDHNVHFTPANLVSTFHRSIETHGTQSILSRIFADEKHFAHHDPLPCGMDFADEGAANHTRLWQHDSLAGLQIFTYGRDAQTPQKTKFPARQSLQACRAIAHLHQLSPITMYFKQTLQAIDAGAFHNDVVCVGHRNVLLLHEQTWEMQPIALRQIAEVFQQVSKQPLHVLEFGEQVLPLKDAIGTYLFNSQIVTLPDESMALIAPIECRENRRVRKLIDDIVSGSNPISVVHYVDVRQSMCNGGGPACLRLRVMLMDEELAAMHQGVIFTDALYESLKEWINKHYREKLSSEDLADPKLLEESREALDELSRLLGLGNIYSFQNQAGGTL